jgi:hypothetical protein
MAKGKLPRGRPPVQIDEHKALTLAGLGLKDPAMAEALGVSLSSWMRWLREGDRREQVQIRRSGNAAGTWLAIEHEAKRGRIGAASILLRRLEMGSKKIGY